MPLDTLRAQAGALAARISHLQDETEQAAEAYDAASTQLAEVVSQRTRATTAAATAAAASQSAAVAVGARVRAVYQAGGPLALYAGLLGTGDVGAMAEQLQVASRVAERTRDTTAAAQASTQHAQAAAAALRALTERAAELQASTAATTEQLRGLLTEETALLARAKGQVAGLVAAEAARQDEQRSAAFAASLEAAQEAAGVPAERLGEAGGEPASPLAARAVAAMTALVAAHPPYEWGGNGPDAYDCSGLTRAAYQTAGLLLPRTAAEQYAAGTAVPLGQLRPGDLLFWALDPGDPSTIHHVAMYAGGGLMWSTNHTGDVARLQPVWGGPELLGAVRPGG